MNTIKIRELSIDQVRELTTHELESLLVNYCNARMTDSPTFVEAERQLTLRRQGDFNLDKSLALIEATAVRGGVLCPLDLATASGLDWKGATYRKISAHLGEIDKYGHDKFGVLLTAIVVLKPNKATGNVEEGGYLTGLIGWAKTLGYQVDNPVAFVYAQRQKTFAWAQERARARAAEMMEAAE